MSPDSDSRLLRYSLLVAGVVVPCFPRATGQVLLTGEPGENAEAGAFYFRDQHPPVLFVDDDYALLDNIATSADRCLPLGLLLQARPHPAAPWATAYQGAFTCPEVGFDPDKCTALVTLTTDDAYRALLENWDTEVNLLDIPDSGPTVRTAVNAELAVLSAGISIEFLRTDTTQEATFLGTDGWAGFLRNTSFISGTATQGSTRERTVLLFRYRLRNVPMVAVGDGTFVPENKTGAGYEVLAGTENTTTRTIDYVKAPSIAGFRPYKIGTYNDWTDPDNPKATRLFGNALLLLGCGETPAGRGFTGTYIQVSGAAGANNAPECPTCLNVRRQVGTNRCRSLWWKFGDFRFGRTFPLCDAVRFVLGRTAAPIVAGLSQPIAALLKLVPPTNALLSTFYTADLNPATGAAGPANEIPRLRLSAASDVKRFGASEPATRLMLSLKQLIADLTALHDTGWFIDPATGYFRLEHRAYAEDAYATGPVVDLTLIPGAILPRAHTTRQAELPRYEELTVANASTQERNGLLGGYEVHYAAGLIDYGAGGCTNARAGQNRTSRAVARLTGDVSALVLSGDSIPDTAVAVLAPDVAGRLSDANRALAASRLLQRYHRRGRAAGQATVNGLPVNMESLRPQREQPGLSVPLCSAAGLGPTVRLTTSLGPNGRLAKRTLNPLTGVVTLTAWLPIPFTARRAVLPTGRQFDNSFDKSFF